MLQKTLPQMYSETYRRAYSTNATDTSFASLIPTVTEPDGTAGTGVYNLALEGTVPQWIMVLPYGNGDADDVFDMWVTGWRKYSSVWVPTRLVKLTCTLGTATGVSGYTPSDTDLFCDTITASMGVSNVSYQLFSTTDNTPAHALVCPNGCQKIQFSFDMTTGNPTAANCLFARV